MIDVGDQLPEFNLPTDGGGMMSNADIAGKKVILFFYPRDNTSGCTKEAIGFTQNKDEFDGIILGCSKDSVKSHDKFVEKQSLGVTLLSDENGSLCEDCGVWKEKSMYGKTYMGIERTTIATDETGKITHIWRKVKVAGHVEEVLGAVQA